MTRRAKPAPPAEAGQAASPAEEAAPTALKLAAGAVTVFSAAVVVIGFATSSPVWLAAAVVAFALVGVVARFLAARRRWRMLIAAVSAIVAALIFGFAAEGVRSAVTNDAPSRHRYFVEQVIPSIAP